MKVLGGEAEIEVEADLDVKDDGGLIVPAWDLTGHKLRGTCKSPARAVKEMVNWRDPFVGQLVSSFMFDIAQAPKNPIDGWTW